MRLITLSNLAKGSSLLILIPLIALVGCTCSAGVSQKQGAYAKCTVHFDPPANQLGSIDVSQGLAAFTLTNMTINNTSGTFTITVTDTATGNQLGQNSFSYYFSSNQLYAQNPTAVENWLATFQQYGTEEVTVKIQAVDVDAQPTIQQGTATISMAANYEGTTYGSASLVETINCKLGVNCKQF